jgi:AcrR family transcriptional regulator
VLGGDVAGGRPGAAKGRPRDPRIEEVVLLATVELLIETGYQGTTIEAIARRSGVSRPAIYRRWRSKAEVISDALFSRVEPVPARDSGDLRADLRAWVQAVLARFSRPEVAAAFPGLIADLREADPTVARGVREELVAPRRASFARTLAAAARRGDLRPGVDPDVVFELMVGSVVFRMLRDRALPDPAYEEQLVDLLQHAVTAPA